MSFCSLPSEAGCSRPGRRDFLIRVSGPQVSPEVILAASLAARFAKLYSLRKTGYVLRSARVLGELGYSVEVVEAGDGVSSRGTRDDSLISGDSIRKLLVKMEQQVDIGAEAVSPPAEAAPPPSKVSTRSSRRAVKQEVDQAQAQARARAVAEQLVSWYNQSVGLSLLEYASFGAGRRLHIRDTTSIAGALEPDTYLCSAVVRGEDGS